MNMPRLIDQVELMILLKVQKYVELEFKLDREYQLECMLQPV